MKITKFKDEIKNLTLDQMNEKLNNTRLELFSLRLNAATAHVKDYSQYKKLRYQIACIETKIKQKSL